MPQNSAINKNKKKKSKHRPKLESDKTSYNELKKIYKRSPTSPNECEYVPYKKKITKIEPLGHTSW